MLKGKGWMPKGVYAKNVSGHAKYNVLERQLMCSFGQSNIILDLDPIASLGEVTQGFSKSLHYLGIHAFLHMRTYVLEPHKIIGLR